MFGSRGGMRCYLEYNDGNLSITGLTVVNPLKHHISFSVIDKTTRLVEATVITLSDATLTIPPQTRKSLVASTDRYGYAQLVTPDNWILQFGTLRD
jgi:hypothetical protein